MRNSLKQSNQNKREPEYGKVDVWMILEDFGRPQSVAKE